MSTEENKTHSGNWSVMSETALAKNFPLHRACRDGDVAALAALLQQEATHRHLTLEDTYYGWTPTHWAAYFGKLECLKVLVESSGSMHAGMTTSRFTQTPAHIAAFAGHPHCLLWLLQTGLNVNTQDYLGETSLHKAARTGSMECVTVLLGSKVQIGILNNNGQTAAQLANACGYSDLANYLLQAEGKQANGDHNGFISRSVPSHGLNGGVFPHSTEMGQLNGTHKADTPSNGFVSSNDHISANGSVTGSNSTFTSSNGYYGFQPTNNPANGSMNGHENIASKSHNQESEDCEMETDANPVETQNGKDNTMEPVLNNYMKSSQNGFCNGNIPKAMSTYTNDSKQNGSREVANGHSAKIDFVNGSPGNQTNFMHKTLPPMEQDITLNDGVSKNYIPIAGCKRSREDVYVPEMKRMKTDESDFTPMNSEKSVSEMHTLINSEMSSETFANYEVLHKFHPHMAKHLFEKTGVKTPALEITEASKPKEFSFNQSSTAKMVASTSEMHTTLSSAQNRGASGHPSGSPAPVPAPLPGYSGTVGCLDAHYPRCLMGHYF